MNAGVRRSAWTRLILAAVTVCSGCARAINPLAVEDALTAVRVQTALVNDAQLGIRAIEVSVSRGIARLSGVVASRDEADRAARIAGAVAGVIRVDADLRVRPGLQARATSGPAALDRSAGVDPPGVGSLVAVGASVSPRYAPDATLDARLSIGPLLRLGSGSGLGPAIGFSWFSADLAAPGGPSDPEVRAGRLSVKPVMGGLSYRVRRGRWSADASVVAGVAFNSFDLKAAAADRSIPVAVRDSFAWRPGTSVWHDTTARIAVNASFGYVVTRPRVTFLEGGELRARAVRADTAILSLGVVYKLF